MIEHRRKSKRTVEFGDFQTPDELAREVCTFMKSQGVHPRSKVSSPTWWIIMTQKKVNAETGIIQEQAPKTWNYLLRHVSQLDKRKSSIYKGKPRFSIFGVGEYTFAPWKVAISGLYKTIHFAVIPPFRQKPGIVDDTCYLIPCKTRAEAHLLADLLNSDIAKEFLNSLIFWDAKRPITVDILRRLDILVLANELGKGEEVRKFFKEDFFACETGERRESKT